MSAAALSAFYLLSVSAGACLAVQAVINSNLRATLGSPWWAGVVSYSVGCLAMLAVALTVDGARSAAGIFGKFNALTWSGGLFGAVFIGTGILMVPRLGAATTLSFVIVGQLVASVALDHFGLMGIAQHPISLARVGGIILLVTGVLLVRS